MSAKYQRDRQREKELADLDSKIERAYFQRQAALRASKPPPLAVSDAAVASMLDARDALLRVETDLTDAKHIAPLARPDTAPPRSGKEL